MKKNHFSQGSKTFKFLFIAVLSRVHPHHLLESRRLGFLPCQPKLQVIPLARHTLQGDLQLRDPVETFLPILARGDGVALALEDDVRVLLRLGRLSTGPAGADRPRAVVGQGGRW